MKAYYITNAYGVIIRGPYLTKQAATQALLRGQRIIHATASA